MSRASSVQSAAAGRPLETVKGMGRGHLRLTEPGESIVVDHASIAVLYRLPCPYFVDDSASWG